METTKQQLNGFDLEAIDNTMSTLKENPKIAEFKFRVSNKWNSGVRNTSTIQGFYGACQEDISRDTPFIYDTDMPYVLNGTNTAPNPPEYLLHSLASCMTTSMMMLASSKGIKVDGVTITIEGDLNLNGFLGLDSCILKEYEGIKVKINIEGDLTNDEKQELLMLSKKSPIYNTIVNPVSVDVSLDQ